MNGVQIDLMAKGNGQGDVAAMLLAQGRIDVGRMRPYISPKDGKAYVTVHTGGSQDDPKNFKKIQVNTGTLRRDEWKALDEAVLGISETRLVGINDLITRGLVYNLGNAMGTTVLESHDISDALEAELTMDGITRGKNDRQVYGTTYLPIPIIHADYEINARVLAASRNMGNGLDTSMAERAARKVSAKLEEMLFTKTTYNFGGGTIYSYLSHPYRGLDTLGTPWDDVSVTGKNIVDKVLSYKQASIDRKHYGPWVLYIPTAYETKMDNDYSTSYNSGTIRERILKIAGVQDVKVIDTLPDDNVIFVQMTSDVVRLVRGMGITNVQWQAEGNMVTRYKVMTIAVPQIRADQNNKCGIIHSS